MRTFFSALGVMATIGLLCMAGAYIQVYLYRWRWKKMSVGERMAELAGRMPPPPLPKGPGGITGNKP